MAFVLSYFLQILLHMLLLLSFFASSDQHSSDLETICSNTLYPKFCRSIISQNQLQTITIQDYGQFCINQSLYITNNFKSLVNQHLQSSKQKYIPQSTKYALQDCRSLTSLSFKFLSATTNLIKSTILDTDQVQTMLSAAMTNLDTCYEGLKEAKSYSNVVQNLSPIISNGTMFLSLSLALFTKGWVRKTNTNNYNPLEFNHIRSENIDGNSINNMRKLLQLGEAGIIVNNMVVVNPDGSGNFTTINDAVDAAPKNTKANSGYFGIYVVGGTYEEYVNIHSNKKYLLMVGDGINQTIITGNRSVGDEWTTYKSATFGK